MYSADPYFRFGCLMVYELFCGCGTLGIRLRVFENRLLKKISGSERLEIIGGG
jgi:hypothetical protein